MVTSNSKNSAEQKQMMQTERKLQTTTQPPIKKDDDCRKESQKRLLATEIRKAQDGNTEATMGLTRKFDPLLEHEALRIMEQKLYSEKEDAKSEAVINFLTFIYEFDDFDADDSRIAGLIKKYLHDIRINQVKAAERHCPACYYVDFEKELEENSPFSHAFPCCEMPVEEKLEKEFRKTALLEAMQILTRKEETIVKKYFIENKPPSLIAKDLHCSTRYLRKAKQNALAKMRIYLETQYPGLRAM